PYSTSRNRAGGGSGSLVEELRARPVTSHVGLRVLDVDPPAQTDTGIGDNWERRRGVEVDDLDEGVSRNEIASGNSGTICINGPGGVNRRGDNSFVGRDLGTAVTCEGKARTRRDVEFVRVARRCVR